MADKVDCMVKVKFGTIFSTMAGAAYLLDNAIRAFRTKPDDIAVSFGIGLLHMALSRSVTGFTLHTIALRFRVAPVCSKAGNKAVEPVGLCAIVCAQGCVRG